MAAGWLLKKLLKENNKTIKWLAEDTGIPLRTLYAITQRDTAKISDANMEKIAKSLGLSTRAVRHYFLAGIEFGENKVTAPTPENQGEYSPDEEEWAKLYNLQWDYDLSESEAISVGELLSLFVNLNDEGRGKVLDYAADLVATKSYLKEEE